VPGSGPGDLLPSAICILPADIPERLTALPGVGLAGEAIIDPLLEDNMGDIATGAVELNIPIRDPANFKGVLVH